MPDNNEDFKTEVTMNAVEVKPNDFIDFRYKNYHGDTQRRCCHVVRFIYGTTPHHLKPQWFIIGEDPSKGFRTFALADADDIRVIYKSR